MHSPALTVGWVRALPRMAEAAQIAALREHPIPDHDIVVEGRQVKGRSRETWAWLLKKLRPDDTLAVVRLRAIYAPRGKLTPAKALLKAVHEIEDHGCRILEISTGLRSWVMRERDMMIAACRDELARSRSGGDAGRPKRELSPADRELVMRHWVSIEHPTNEAALRAIREEARAAGRREVLRLRSVQAVTNVFGASGRARLRRKVKTT